MTTAVAESAPKRGVIRSALGETAASLRAVFGHRALRRIQLALAGSLIGDWAYATAVIVWAYGVGGAKAVGLFAASRYVLMAVGAPFAATLADRWPRKRVMIGADLARFALVVAAAGCIAAATPAIVVFALAAVTFMLGSVFRPAQAAWLPSLVERPEQLTASNAVASTLESVAFFLGPALGAALVATTDVQTVFLVNAATFLWSAGLVLSIAAPRSQQRDTGDSGPAEGALARCSPASAKSAAAETSGWSCSSPRRRRSSRVRSRCSVLSGRSGSFTWGRAASVMSKQCSV